jgi:hypothetical protein
LRESIRSPFFGFEAIHAPGAFLSNEREGIEAHERKRYGEVV